MAAHRPARLDVPADDGVEYETLPPLLRSVLIIYTGGTIGMKPTPRGYSPAPGYLQELIETMPMFHDTCAACPRSPSQPPPAHLEAGFYEDVRHQTLEQLDRDADVHADLRPPRRNIGRQMISPEDADGRRILFRFLDYDPLMDSSNMTHVEWQRIARDICHYYLRFDGFVVLHGTDTMAYTASALSFFLENLGKPVVLTGSQIPICRQRNDGLMNLVGALNVAAFHHIPEVCALCILPTLVWLCVCCVLCVCVLGLCVFWVCVCVCVRVCRARVLCTHTKSVRCVHMKYSQQRKQSTGRMQDTLFLND